MILSFSNLKAAGNFENGLQGQLFFGIFFIWLFIQVMNGF